MSVYTFVCAHAHTFTIYCLNLAQVITEASGLRTSTWPAGPQTAASVVPIWRPQAQDTEIQEELRFRFESRGRKHGCPGVQRQEEFPLVCGKVRVVLFGLSADWMRLLHWRGQPPSSGHYFKSQSHPKHPTPPHRHIQN